MGVSSVQTLENWGFFQYQRIDQSFSHSLESILSFNSIVLSFSFITFISISLATRSIEPVNKYLITIRSFHPLLLGNASLSCLLRTMYRHMLKIWSGARDVEVDLIWDRLRFWDSLWPLQLLSSFCDDETMTATTSPLLSSAPLPIPCNVDPYPCKIVIYNNMDLVNPNVVIQEQNLVNCYQKLVSYEFRDSPYDVKVPSNKDPNLHPHGPDLPVNICVYTYKDPIYFPNVPSYLNIILEVILFVNDNITTLRMTNGAWVHLVHYRRCQELKCSALSTIITLPVLSLSMTLHRSCRVRGGSLYKNDQYNIYIQKSQEVYAVCSQGL
ncbi:hypothetical protein Prudu_500S000100, partial [Prunus dulcis]